MPLKTVVQNLKSHNSDKPILVVFDLDSTLFNVSPRTEKILKEFSNDLHYKALYPKQAEALNNVEVKNTDWGIKQAISRLQIEGPIEFFDDIKNYWIERFFSNAYLHFDEPYEGAINYVQSLKNLGARIMYLTGRDQHRMGLGSIEVLKKHNFPVDDHHQLILKPEKGMSDSKFKRDVFLELKKQHSNIWFFENEPVNINLLQKEIPKINVVFVDSVHSSLEPAPTHLPTVRMSYIIKE